MQHNRPFANLIIRESRKIGGIAIDGVINETTIRTMNATEFPIESGDIVSDHIIRRPMTYTMHGEITDTPFGLEGIRETISSTPENISGLFGASDPSAFTRSQQIYNELVKIMDLRQPIDVQTTLNLYKNLAFESITVTQDKDTSRGISFIATFKELVFVNVDPVIMGQDGMPDDVDKASMGREKNNGRATVQDLIQ